MVILPFILYLVQHDNIKLFLLPKHSKKIMIHEHLVPLSTQNLHNPVNRFLLLSLFLHLIQQ